jgi:hypothetical protein
VRPSTAGIERVLGFGVSGTGEGGGGAARYGVGSGRREPDLRDLLREAIEPGLAACADQLHRAIEVTLVIETTRDEIVDVDVRGAAVPEIATCLGAAAWAIPLPSAFHDARESYELDLSQPAPDAAAAAGDEASD